ncbi:MAG: zeta toxin family protein [Granulosicoccus sp.]
MQLRRFTAASTPAALGAVRSALGENAIILANRRVGDQVEIIATGQMDDGSTTAELNLEELQTGQGNSTEETAYQSTPKPGSIGASESVTQVKHHAAKGSAGKSAASVVKNDSDSKPGAIRLQDVDYSRNHLTSDDPLDSASEALVSTYQQDDDARLSEVGGYMADRGESTSREHTSTADSEHRFLNALETQTDLINDHFRSLAVSLWGSRSPDLSMHLQRLVGLGIGAELAVRLVERADPDMHIEQALRHSLALLKATLPIGSDKTFSTSGVTVLYGAPGSGKTTVLVKMAAQHLKEHGADSIVLICADTRRIGAFEELQAYGRILGVPVVHAHDTSEMESLVSAFTHKQLVLVDHTLPNTDEAVKLPRSLTEISDPDSVRHLFVLPAGMQSATAESLIEQQCTNQRMNCILTHLDSTARLGELFSPIIRHHLPIAYWSDTSSVQQQLRKADASVLVATAVAMSRKINVSKDEQWLNRLIQPTPQLSAKQSLELNEFRGKK